MRIVIDIDWDNGNNFKVVKDFDEYKFYADAAIRAYHEAIEGLDQSYAEARAALVGMHQVAIQRQEAASALKAQRGSTNNIVEVRNEEEKASE